MSEHFTDEIVKAAHIKGYKAATGNRTREPLPYQGGTLPARLPRQSP